MTKFMENALRNNDYDYLSFEKLFERVFAVLRPLTPAIYRQKNGAFATSLYDVITYGVANYIDIYETSDFVSPTLKVSPSNVQPSFTTTHLSSNNPRPPYLH